MRSSIRWRAARAWLGAAAAVTALACSKDHGSDPQPTGIQAAISAIALEGTNVTATVHNNAVPASSGGPAANVTVGSAAVVGGSTRITVGAAQEFTRILVRLQDSENGWYELNLPAPTTSANIVLSTAQGLTAANGLPAAIAVGTSGGSVGAYSDADIQLVAAGQGDVQVSVSWDAESDVDLHLVQPGDNQEIYYGDRTDATTGGELDVDSNPNCSIDHIKNENITYGTHAPPRGQYIVRLDYYDGCDVPQTNWVVTVRVKGQTVKTFTGTFTGSGDGGGLGDGQTIYTFNY